MEIMFKDLKKEIQKEVLKFYCIENQEELNLDISPLFILKKG